MARIKNNVSTSKLLTMIREAGTFEEAVSYHQTSNDPLFNDVLYKMIQERGLTPKDIIITSGIDRSYFYHILSGVKMPGRNMVLRIGFCLHVNLNEMNHLLTLAGTNSLYPKIRRDAALIYAIQHKFTMEQANDLLLSEREEPLFWKQKNA